MSPHLDALVDMVRIAAGADDGTLFGRRAPSVRVHVPLADLDRRAGRGHLEGQSVPISIESVERLVCRAAGLFDGRGADPVRAGRRVQVSWLRLGVSLV